MGTNKSMVRSAVVVLLVALVGLSAAADLYVQQSATGLAPCTQAAPCGDIATAFGAAVDGDKIIIQGPSILPVTGSLTVLPDFSLTILANNTDGPVRIDLDTTRFADIQGIVTIEGVHFNCTGTVGGNGGALSVSAAAAALTLTNVNFEKCTSDANGGAVAVLDGRLTVNGGSFKSCAADNGGAIHVSVDAASIFVSGNTVFEANTASVMDGGAVYAVSTTLNPLGDIFFQDAIFRNNMASSGSGGAVYAHTTARTKFVGCTFESNSALSGGAINLPLSSNFENCFVQDCIFQSNVATGTSISLKSGGAIFHTNPVDIRNTQFFMNNASRDGGAIFSQAEITIADSTFEKNNAQGTSSGGALFLDYASVPQLHRNSFMGNIAAGSGAAIHGESLTVSAVANEFSSNVAGTRGGAIFNKVGVLTIIGGSLASNAAGTFGGAVFTAGLTTVSGATFTSNNATSGGAIYCSSVAQGATALDLSVANTMFTMNEANSADGGAIFGGACSLTISGSKFKTNTAAAQGGAVSSASATIAVTNTEFSMNSAENGGGIHAASSSSFSLTGITGTSNVANTQGGFVYGSGVADPIIRSSPVSGGSPQDFHFVQGDSNTVQVIDTAAVGSIDVSNGTIQIVSAQPVTMSGFTLLGQSSLSTNANITITGTMMWEDGTISTQSTEMIVLSLVEGAVANFVRAADFSASTRMLNRVHLFSAGELNIGVIADAGTAQNVSSANLTAATEGGVKCLTLASNASVILSNVATARARIGYGCIIAVDTNTSSSRFNVSSYLDIDGPVIMYPGFTAFNKTAANLVFHIRMMDATETKFQDVDHLMLKNVYNHTMVGGNITVVPSKEFGAFASTNKLSKFMAPLISGAWVVGNFTHHIFTDDFVGETAYNSLIWGSLRSTVAGTNLTVFEADRPDPNSGHTVVIIVSIILALIGGGVLAFYIYTVVKCFKKSGDDEESDDSDDEEAGEKKSLTQSSADAEKREKEAMAKIDADEKAAAKGASEVKEIADDEKPAKKGKGKGKGKEKEVAPEPVPEPAAEPVEEKPKKKSSPKAEEKPAPAEKSSKKKKAESSEEPSEQSDASSDQESEEAVKKPLKSSGKTGAAAKKGTKAKQVESSSTESDADSS